MESKPMSAAPTPPMNCPMCGGGNLCFINRNSTQFQCGSVARQGTMVIQTAICTTHQRDQLQAKLNQLTAAGQDAIDYIDGKHRDAGRVLDGWRKASE